MESHCCKIGFLVISSCQSDLALAKIFSEFALLNYGCSRLVRLAVFQFQCILKGGACEWF